jgi:hypothetical protein
MRGGRNWRWDVGSVVLLAIVSAFSVGAVDDPALEQYLSRLGLTELRLNYLERQLVKESEPAKRGQLAIKLADAYAEELAASADEPERFARFKSGAEKLLAEYPEAKSAAVQAALLQAEYQRGEALVIRWMENPTDRKPLTEAAAILGQVQPKLSALHAELVKAEERAAEAIERMTNEAARQAAEARLTRQRTVAIQADYFAGWSAYYMGVAAVQARSGERGTGSGQQKEFAMAKEHFSRVLDVAEEKDYASVEAEALGLDSIWRARTAIGLGLAEIAQRHAAAAGSVFGWLAKGNAPQVIRDQAGYWQMQGMLNVGMYDEASKFMAKEIERLAGNPSAGKSSLCIAAIHGGAARAGEGEPLVEMGVRGLARMRQFETADKLVEKYKLEERLRDRFCVVWLRGRREYLAAEKGKSAAGFEAAKKTLTAALAMPEAKREANDAAQARYYVAWAYFRLDEIDAAGRLFNEAALGLAFSAPEVAAQAAWMHCTCLVQLASKDKRQVSTAQAALEAYLRDYPASEEAQQVESLAARLRQSQLPPREAISELSAIKPGDANYASAQYEICQLQYQLWSKVKGDSGKAKPLAAEVLKAVDGFISASDTNRDGLRRLKASLLAVDVLLNDATPAWERVGELLTSVAAPAGQLEVNSGALIEYQYRRMQLAEHRGDGASVQQAAMQIVRSGAGTVYELPALAAAARAADAAFRVATPADRRKQAVEAERLYSRIVELLGDSPAALANKNALAASSKLAEYDEELENWERAAGRLKKLVDLQPKDRRLLRRAGVACIQAGQFAAALDYWRTLAAGLTAGSEEWFEAKYFQLACLEKTDRAAAQNVLKQFRVLYPEVKSAAWRDKFIELAQRL